jgi:hypothetical protein
MNAKSLLDFSAQLLFIALLAVATPVTVPADAPSVAAPDVVALVVPLNADAEPFSSVVGGAVPLRFTGLVLDVRTLPVPGDAPPDDDTLAAQVGVTSAGALLICRFSVVNGEMSIQLDWHDLQAGSRATVTGETAALDLSLDVYIRRVLDSLLVQVQSKVDGMAAQRQAAISKASAAPETPAPAAAPAPEPAPAPVAMRPVMEDDTKARPFLVSTGIAPFVPVGALAAYAGLGYMTSAAAELAVPVPRGRLGAGMSLGVVSFSAQGASGLTASILIPVGLDASYRLGTDSPAGLLFRLTGGAAVFFVSSPSIGTEAKIIPFLRGAAGVELLFSRTVGLLLDAGYEVYFEMPVLIMGVTPALELSIRL